MYCLNPYLIPGGSIYTTIMEFDPQNHSKDGLLGPNSIMLVYMDPLGVFYGIPCPGLGSAAGLSRRPPNPTIETSSRVSGQAYSLHKTHSPQDTA